MEFFNSAVYTLQTIVIGSGRCLCGWGRGDAPMRNGIWPGRDTCVPHLENYMNCSENCDYAIRVAVDCASRTGGILGTEHLLVGISDSGAAAEVLRRLGISPRDIAQMIPWRNSRDNVRFSSRAKRCVETAADIAACTGSGVIGTEHVFAALLHERDGVAVGML